MKIYQLALFASFLALSSCGTAYQNAQSSDAVYYSPSKEQSYATTARATDAYNDSDGADNYVVYDNNNEDYSDYKEGYSDGYTDGYYSRRINMFDRPGGLLSYNLYMMNNPFYYGGGFGMGMYSPLMYSPGLSLGLGLTIGSPFGYGGWYDPFYSPFYNPFYSGFYSPFYSPFYGASYYPYYSGLGYGYMGGKYSIVNPRPAATYQPRRTMRSTNVAPAAGAGRQIGTSAPRRVINTNRPSERVISNGRAAQGNGRRIFRSENGERTIGAGRSAETRTRTRTEIAPRRAARSYTPPARETESSRSFEPSRNTYTPSRGSSVTPSRSFSSPSSGSMRSSGGLRSSGGRR